MIPSALTAADRRALSWAGMGEIAVQNVYFIQREGESTRILYAASDRCSREKERAEREGKRECEAAIGGTSLMQSMIGRDCKCI